jgi:hypothetical protein
MRGLLHVAAYDGSYSSICLCQCTQERMASVEPNDYIMCFTVAIVVDEQPRALLLICPCACLPAVRDQTPCSLLIGPQRPYVQSCLDYNSLQRWRSSTQLHTLSNIVMLLRVIKLVLRVSIWLLDSWLMTSSCVSAWARICHQY